MKLAALLLLATASISLASIGGPGPFRNESPLTTGIDGAYQAVVRGSNISGVIRFTISNGVQTGTPSGFATGANNWVMFYNGTVASGGTSAAIVGTKVSGVLDGNVNYDGLFPAPPNPIIISDYYMNNRNQGNGSFQGSIALRSASAEFHGKGIFTPASIQEFEVVGVDVDADGNLIMVNWSAEELGAIPTDIPFKFTGVRANTGS